MSAESLAIILGLALVDCLSPSLMVITIATLLSGGRQTWLRLLVYWGVVAGLYFLLGVALMLGLGVVVGSITEPVALWIQLLVGVAMITASFLIVPGKTANPAPDGQTVTLRGMAALGFGTWAFEAATAVPFFGAVALMTSEAPPVTQWIAVLGAYVVIMVAPGFVIATLWTALGERARSRLEGWRERLMSGSRETLSWIIGAIGMVVVLEAGARLAQQFGWL